MLPPLLSLVVGEDAYCIVHAKTISSFACTFRRCFSYAPERLYFRRQNGHLLGMGKISQIISALGSFEGKAIRMLSTTHVDYTSSQVAQMI